MKDGKKGQLSKLARLEKDKDGNVLKDKDGKGRKVILESRKEVEEEAVGFFSNLFQGFHKRG